VREDIAAGVEEGPGDRLADALLGASDENPLAQ